MRLGYLIFLAWLSIPMTNVHSEELGTKPRGLLFPWEMPGLSYDFRGRHRDELRQSWDLLRDLYLPMPVSLYQFGRNNARNFTLNQKRRSEGFAVSTQHHLANIDHSTYLQPILCPIQERLYLILLVGHYDSGAVLQLISQSLPINTRLPAEVYPTEVWTSAVRQLWEELQRQPPQAPGTQDDVMKLGLSLLRGAMDQQLGTALCPQLLAAEALLAQLPIRLEIDQLNLVHARDTLGPAHPLSRANRMLGLAWPDHLSPARPNDDNDFEVQASFSEAVFARTIDRRQSYRFSWTAGGKLRPDPDLISKLHLEQQKLRKDEWPMVAKIFGAWAYVDRGRAWGLEMNDRLITFGEEQPIKGHVVKYFGPEMGIRSPRGFLITEGAIVFIRTGQRRVKVGDVFQFDPTSFPADWPPAPTPADHELR